MRKNCAFIFILLCFVTLISGMELVGTGSQDNPYQISSLEHLQWMTTTDFDGYNYFIQTADIDMYDTINWELRDHDDNPNTPDSTVGFKPIGSEENPFTGSYDGQNYYISNLYINRPWETVALFRNCRDSKINNIIIKDASIKGRYAASICGRTDDSEITKCYSNAQLVANESCGGLCYRMVESSIKECTFEGSIYAKGAGGIVFDHVYTIYYNTLYPKFLSHCLSKGYIYGTDSASGIVNYCRGYTYKGFENEYNTIINNNVSKSDVISDRDAAGIAIYCENTEFVENHNIGNVAGNTSSGLLYGASESLIYKCSSVSNLGTLNDSIISSMTVGLVFDSEENIIRECYTSGKLSSTQQSCSFIHFTGRDSLTDCYSSAELISNRFKIGFIEDLTYPINIKNYLFIGETDSIDVFTCMTLMQPSNSLIADNCFWDKGKYNIDSFVFYQNTPFDTLGLSTEQMKSINTYTDLSNDFLSTPFDFVDNPFDDTLDGDIWNIDPAINNGYPYLVNNPPLTVTEVSEDHEFDGVGFSIPEVLEISGNYPNPFNPATTIKYSLVDPAQVTVEIYNVKGQKVKTIDKGFTPRGNHEVVWNGDDNNNTPAASGVYFYNFKINGKSKKIRKCMLLK